MTKTGLSIRVALGGHRIGPGKVALLEAIAVEGSISAAARRMKMSYKRAWDLVEELNRIFETPVVTAAAGGSRGGGASLTSTGEDVVLRYRAIEQDALKAVDTHIAALAFHMPRVDP